MPKVCGLAALVICPLFFSLFVAAQAPDAPPNISQIQHIVYIIKENRSFDSFFGTFLGANGATTAKISTGQTITMGHLADQMPNDITGHGWFDAITGMDGGKMDRFELDPRG